MPFCCCIRGLPAHRLPRQISAFISDYSAAVTRASTFDAKVQSDASKISSDYAGIVAASLRQAFGATEITVSRTSSGFNTSDVLMFMKGARLGYHLLSCAEPVCQRFPVMGMWYVT